MSRFITPQHPKASLTPSREAFVRILAAGSVGQLKANGHRLQAHLSPDGDLIAYTRQGTKHTTPLPAKLKQALLEMFKPNGDWTVIDAEWQKQQGKLYLFDILMIEGKSLSPWTYEERHDRLSAVAVPNPALVEVLPLLYTVEECLAVISNPSPFVEGLVFRNVKAKGFNDSAIVRCRKSGIQFKPEKLTL